MSPGGMSRRSKKRWSSERGRSHVCRTKKLDRPHSGGRFGRGGPGRGRLSASVYRRVLRAAPLRGTDTELRHPGGCRRHPGPFFAFGAAVGVATLPFEGEGRSVLLRSGLHFLVTAGLLGAILRVCLGVAWRYLPGWLALLGAIYLVVWLGRWVGWYAEVRQLRSALGLEAGPSPLRWRESLPYLPVLLLVNAVLPAVLALLDAPDVPVLRALLIPCLLLPLGGFFPALSLGKRQGVCLLYPAASLLIFLPASLWVYGGQRIPLFWGIALACPLAGNLVGAAWRRRKERRRP